MQDEYIKDFNSWAEYCKLLEAKDPNNFVHERELWWCSLGTNIGSEQDGKNEYFERPVLILKVFKNNLLLIAPITSKISAHEDRFDSMILGEPSQILIGQIRTVSRKRLQRKMGWLKEPIFYKLLMKMIELQIQ